MPNSSRRAYSRAQKVRSRDLAKIPCPNCNSPQEFRERYRPIDETGFLAELIEVYIRCTLCRKEWRIRVITPKERKQEAIKARASRPKIT